MLKNLMIHKRVTISLCMLIILSFIGMRYFIINSKFPNPIIYTSNLGETVEYDNINIDVVSKKLYSMTDFDKNTQEQILSNFPELRNDFRICVIELDYKNTTKSAQTLEVYRFMLQSGAWSNGVDRELFEMFNETPTMKLCFEPNEEKKTFLTFSMIKNSFRSKDWSNIDNRNFDLVLSVYPIKKSIQLY